MISTSQLTDFVSLSFLSVRMRLAALEMLRGGDEPARVLAVVSRTPGDAQDAASLRARAAAALARAAARGIRLVCWSDAAYPMVLGAIADAPLVLWSRGQLTALDRPAVALVGSRAASPYGLAVSERLAAELGSRGVTIVSGLARGIDSAAHRGALKANAPTVAVLGSGVDVVYPPEHRELARDIEATGLVVSELAPGTPPLKAFFPRRNRIISGLSRAVVVVEAGQRSGSLITARAALDQGRDVLAVPGNILSGCNRGAHGLLRDGAKIVESPDDILEELGLGERRLCCAPDAADDPVLGCLAPGEPVDLDAIAERSGIAPQRLLTRLFELEMQGLVCRAGGGRFVRS